MTDYIERTYRGITDNGRYASFEIAVFETDLKVYVDNVLQKELNRIEPLTAAYAKALRDELELYIHKYPDFAATLEPWPDDDVKSPVVKEMIAAGNRCGVGPMAAVAGALAEFGARYLQNYSRSVIVENGGDIFVAAAEETVVGIFAGDSPLSMRLGLVVPAGEAMGVCTSSGTVGPSFSMGKADAVCVAAKNAALADALATALANMIETENDFEKAMQKAQNYDDVLSVLFICGDKSAIWGGLEIRPL